MKAYNPLKPFIAKDTKKPLVVLGCYPIGEGGAVIRETVKHTPGKDYGADPLADGNFLMVPSGDVVDLAERNKRLGKIS